MLILYFDDLFESLLRSQNYMHASLYIPRSLGWNVYFCSFLLTRLRFLKSWCDIQVLVSYNHTLNRKQSVRNAI